MAPIEAGWLAFGLATVNMAQVVLLAYISTRSRKMVGQLDGHLSHLEATQATDAELKARTRGR